MKAAMGLLAGAMAILIAAPCAATTWHDSKRADPFARGAKCQTPELTSSGSYVFDWPSKYDGVYSPGIDPPFIWRCPKSGYLSYADDFTELSVAQKAAVEAWLRANPADIGKLDATALMERLEALYRIREKPPEFWAHFYRVRAVWSADPAVADGFRAKALPLLKARLQDGTLGPFERAMTYYLIGYYSRRLGLHSDSARAFADSAKVDWSSFKTDYGDVEEARRGNIAYIARLVSDVEAGKLDGACGQFQVEQPDCPLSREAAERQQELEDPESDAAAAKDG